MFVQSNSQIYEKSTGQPNRRKCFPLTYLFGGVPLAPPPDFGPWRNETNPTAPIETDVIAPLRRKKRNSSSGYKNIWFSVGKLPTLLGTISSAVIAEGGGRMRRERRR